VCGPLRPGRRRRARSRAEGGKAVKDLLDGLNLPSLQHEAYTASEGRAGPQNVVVRIASGRRREEARQLFLIDQASPGGTHQEMRAVPTTPIGRPILQVAVPP